MLRAPHQWRISPFDLGRVRPLAEALGLSPIVAHLLQLRGIDSVEQGQRFLSPSLTHLSDPLLLRDMEKAVARIKVAREKQEAVLVFGDYDVDGISATAILINGLRRFGLEHVSYGMPQRLEEGYGLNAERVEAASEAGVSLIITVDNGIAAHEAAARAQALGLDLIITDHHAFEGALPPACAVVNPKRESDDHPAWHLCGAGVAFKLSLALNHTPNDLDITALGTVADIVPLQGENRVLVAYGLKHMARHQRTGIAELSRIAKIDISRISSENIGFQLGPRLNAAGRLDNGMLALQLLFSDAPSEAQRMARDLNVANEARRAIERAIFEEAVEELEATLTPEARSIVLARPDWHAGVIGIVASRLYSRYCRPVVMITLDGAGEGRGSARSGPGFNMVEAFRNCAAHLEQFGGHKSAAGMQITTASLPRFQQAFEAEALRQLGPGPLAPALDIDVLASFSQIDSQLIRDLERLEPVGHKNPAPLFCTHGVEVVPQSARLLQDQHLKLSLRQNGQQFDAIGFNMAERFYTEDLSGQVDVAYTPQFNEWRGEVSIQLLLRDIRSA